MDRAVLFDIDGTLVDSTEAVTAVWRAVAERHGVDAEQILQVCHGRRDEDVVPEFFPRQLVPLVVAQIAELELARAGLVRPIPGAMAVLESLAVGSWAAVTSGSRALMTARLRGAGLPVPEVLVTADDVSRGKPDPEGYLLAARQLEVDVTSCVVVEDSPAGVAAGKAAGAAVIALANTHSADELSEADVVIERTIRVGCRRSSRQRWQPNVASVRLSSPPQVGRRGRSPSWCWRGGPAGWQCRCRCRADQRALPRNSYSAARVLHLMRSRLVNRWRADIRSVRYSTTAPDLCRQEVGAEVWQPVELSMAV